MAISEIFRQIRRRIITAILRNYVRLCSLYLIRRTILVPSPFKYIRDANSSLLNRTVRHESNIVD